MISMTGRNNRLMCWSGPVMAVVLATGAVVGHLIVPLTPAANPAEIMQYYTDNRLSILIGTVIVMFAIGLLTPWLGSMTVHLARVEGARALAWMVFALGALIPMETLLALYMRTAAAMKISELTPEVAMALNTVSWLVWIGLVYTAVIQIWIEAYIILSDKRSEPIYPRWAGYLNILVGTIWASAGFVQFTTSGYFAWNGLCWYLTLASFFVWIACMTKLSLDATARQEREEAAPVATAPAIV